MAKVKVHRGSAGRGGNGGAAARRPDMRSVPAEPRPQPASAAPASHDFVTLGLMLLALCATMYIWLYQPLSPSTQLKMTGIVWLVAVLGAIGRMHARRMTAHLRARLAHDQFFSARLAPDISEADSGVRMRHVSVWIVVMIGIAATTMLWLTGALDRGVGGPTALLVGMTVTVLFALIVAANTVNRRKAQRLSRDFRTALNSERLALGTLASVDAMVCACLPSGERTRFNERYLQFLGRSAEQLQGHGWLDLLQVDDRKNAVELATRPLSARGRPRQHDMCVRRPGGGRAWLRETLTPRFDDDGKLIEFICTAVDITAQVEAEAALDEQVGALKKELAETAGELSKARTSRSRFEKGLEEAREEIKTLREALTRTEAALTRTTAETAARIKEIESDARQRIRTAEEDAEKRARRTEQAFQSRIEKLEASLRVAEQESEQAATDNRILSGAFDDLQKELAESRQQEGDARAQLVRHIKETREARGETTEAQTLAAQHRAKVDRLQQRCEELEQQLAARDADLASARSQAQQAGAAALAEAERRMHEISAEALAQQLRKQLDGMQRMTSELLGASTAGPVQDAAYNTAASLRTMSDLVDQALTGTQAHNGAVGDGAAAPVPRPAIAGPGATSFDLRRTARGVRDMLAESARARGVKLEVQIAPRLPALVYGDDIEIRTALLSLTDAALILVEDGTLSLRLSEDVSTGAYSTIRCEMRHTTARVRSDAVETMLAIKSSDNDMPDAAAMPLAHQAAKAWRTIRKLQGQHGYMLPDEGGFMVWFTFTLDRPAAAAAAAAAPAATAPANSQPNTDAAHAFDASDAPRSSTEAAAQAVAVAVAPVTYQPALEPASDTAVQIEEIAPRQPVNMPRMPQELLTCNLGEVVELGADSIRLNCSKPPKGDITITFKDVETDLALRAELEWSTKISGRKHDVGLKFVGVTPAEQKEIVRLAMQHRRVATMLDEKQES